MEVRNRLRLEREVVETDQGRRGDMRGTGPATAGNTHFEQLSALPKRVV